MHVVQVRVAEEIEGEVVSDVGKLDEVEGVDVDEHPTDCGMFTPLQTCFATLIAAKEIVSVLARV